MLTYVGVRLYGDRDKDMFEDFGPLEWKPRDFFDAGLHDDSNRDRLEGGLEKPFIELLCFPIGKKKNKQSSISPCYVYISLLCRRGFFHPRQLGEKK